MLAQQRQELVSKVRAKPKTTAPRIEPTLEKVEVSARVERERERERQVPLFEPPASTELPSLSLLDDPPPREGGYSPEALEAMSRLVELKLSDFGVEAEVVAVHPGPVVTRFELKPAAGVKSSQISNLRQDGDNDVVDVRTSKGDTFQLSVSRATKLPARVAMLDAHPNLGDVLIATAISDYEDVSGVKMPKRLTTTIDKYPQFDLRVAKSAVDVDVSALVAPDAVKSAAAATPPQQVVTVEPVAKREAMTLSKRIR